MVLKSAETSRSSGRFLLRNEAPTRTESQSVKNESANTSAG